MRIISFIRGTGSFIRYYKLLNELYKIVYGRNLMIHFPFYKNDSESFEQRQINLVDHCISKFSEISKKTLAILVRLYLKELRKHKKYMVFAGGHA